MPRDREETRVREEPIAESYDRSVRRPAEESPNFFDERFDFSEPYDVLEPGDADSSPTTGESGVLTETTESRGSAGSSGSAEDDDKRPRRRRRRRRRGGKRDSEARGSQEPSETLADEPLEALDRSEEEPAVEVDEGGDGAGDKIVDRELGEAESATAGLSEKQGEEGERRSKRHRSRRKKRSRGDEGERTDADVGTKAAKEHARSTRAESSEDDHGDTPGDTPADSDQAEAFDEEGDEDGVSARVGFRGIPTWDEAVGMIVAKNLESRAKRPGGGNGAPRGRGGQRGGRGGGGGQRGGGRSGGGRKS